jgi:DNA-binding MarR family transcriptional regulator
MEPVYRLENLSRFLGGHEALVGRRFDEGQRDGVDADVIRRELDRHVLVRACRPAWAIEYALVGVVAIASIAHIEPTLYELIREVVLSPTAMSCFIDRVEAAGHVRREPDPANRRALRITITETGIDLLRRMWPIYADGIDRYFASHLGSSRRRIRTALERMADVARDNWR